MLLQAKAIHFNLIFYSLYVASYTHDFYFINNNNFVQTKQEIEFSLNLSFDINILENLKNTF